MRPCGGGGRQAAAVVGRPDLGRAGTQMGCLPTLAGPGGCGSRATLGEQGTDPEGALLLFRLWIAEKILDDEDDVSQHSQLGLIVIGQRSVGLAQGVQLRQEVSRSTGSLPVGHVAVVADAPLFSGKACRSRLVRVLPLQDCEHRKSGFAVGDGRGHTVLADGEDKAEQERVHAHRPVRVVRPGALGS